MHRHPLEESDEDDSRCRHHQCHSLRTLDPCVPPYACPECQAQRRSLPAPLLCVVCSWRVCPLHPSRGGHVTREHPFVAVDVVSAKTTCFECGGGQDWVRREADNTRALLEDYRTRPGAMKRKRGLANLGNTCYLNAVMQALHHTGVMDTPPPANGHGASAATAAHPAPPPPPPEPSRPNSRARATPPAPPPTATVTAAVDPSSLYEAYQSLFPSSSSQAAAIPSHATGNGNSPSPDETTAFVALVKAKMPTFASLLQQDAHEFLRIFTDQVQREQAWVSDPFKGTIVSEMTCKNCGRVQSKVDPCLDLSLEFPDSSGGDRVVRFVTGPEGGAPLHPRVLRLGDCLRRFFSLEQAIFAREVCASCHPQQQQQQQQRAPPAGCTPRVGRGGAPPGPTPAPAVTTPGTFSKRLKLHTLPTILVIHLKRFKWTWDSCEKIQTFVQFPMRDLCLDEFRTTAGALPLAASSPNTAHTARQQLADGSVRYDLLSVVCHHGRSFLHGHYTCYSLDKREGTWYHFNDDVVAPVDEEVVARSQAYLLFYERRRRRA